MAENICMNKAILVWNPVILVILHLLLLPARAQAQAYLSHPFDADVSDARAIAFAPTALPQQQGWLPAPGWAGFGGSRCCGENFPLAQLIYTPYWQQPWPSAVIGPGVRTTFMLIDGSISSSQVGDENVDNEVTEDGSTIYRAGSMLYLDGEHVSVDGESPQSEESLRRLIFIPQR